MPSLLGIPGNWETAGHFKPSLLFLKSSVSSWSFFLEFLMYTDDIHLHHYNYYHRFYFLCLFQYSSNFQFFAFFHFPLITNPSALAEYDTRSVFKWSLRGLNSVFLSLTSCLTKAEEPSLSNYLPIAFFHFQLVVCYYSHVYHPACVLFYYLLMCSD